MKLKQLGALIICALTSSLCWADSIHKVAEGETVWFLAEVYYGTGAKYEEILKSNNLKKPEDLKVGVEIVLPLPKYSNKDEMFKQRYNEVRQKKSDFLALKKKGAQPDSKISAKSQSNKDLPKELMKKDLKGKSPLDAAKDELKRSAGH